ncbi:MAG: ubiquinone biosynthesis protein [Alphaproteobacteria bacterium]|nr:MAG: ubiquinone biosynthesis protein [Caulobacteraceae bacterium]TPW08723.1 MAG: ubiquinone biosynthesis protein [Alphaproteobacteria bacterium]
MAAILLRYDALLPAEYQSRLPWWAQALSKFFRLFARPRRGQSPGERLATALEKLGPAYVKLGQFLATRPDFIGVTAAQDLARLKDRLPPFSREKALDTINAEFGSTVDLFGETFSEAMAAASIAQVHQARPNRQHAVAVKILRPNIEKKMAREMGALHFGARLIEFFIPSSRRLEPVNFIETVSTAMERELDLRLEAGAAAEFKEVAEKDGFLSVPSIDWARSGKRVMTLDWIDGTALTDHVGLRAAGADLPGLAISVTRGFLAAALDHGFFHADMHEGNLIYGRDGKLWIVDFGIMGRIGHKERRYLAEILYGFLRRDYKRVAEVHQEAGYVPEKFTVEEFAQALRAIGEPIFGKTADQVSMSKLLLQLFDITHMFGMHLRPELVMLQKTMVQVEGVSRTLDPRHDMWAAARPIVERWVRRELGAESTARRAIDEAGAGLGALRRLPQTLAALEGAANAIRSTPSAAERVPFQWRHFWVGAVAGVMTMLALMVSNAPRSSGPMQPTSVEAKTPVKR